MFDHIDAVCFENEGWVRYLLMKKVCHVKAVNKKPSGNELISLLKNLRRNGAHIPYKGKTLIRLMRIFLMVKVIQI